ncbi:hypothetical protein WN55_01467 [Dufourea novaeangliae]|uniref:Uncharacterized protein n=1 Tax=Dufourea novaeangliae TaxID=178035 RepID=A0A154PET6_DUFNO|nr:hypothetical protein WN55_01467 [Dufourea novaeangliae]
MKLIIFSLTIFCNIEDSGDIVNDNVSWGTLYILHTTSLLCLKKIRRMSDRRGLMPCHVLGVLKT